MATFIASNASFCQNSTITIRPVNSLSHSLSSRSHFPLQSPISHLPLQSPRSHLPLCLKSQCRGHLATFTRWSSLPKQPNNPSSSSPKREVVGPHRQETLTPTRIVRAAATSSSSSGGRRESRWDPLLANSDVGCPVPPEQQPVNEYADLSDALFFSWATMGPFNLSIRLAAIGVFFSVAVGFPISAASFDPQKQALQCVLSAIGGGLFPVALATVRLFLGWSYIGGRLSSATVEYEETGWYDGQIWVKTPELLARDRLLASYRVKPVLRRLRTALIGLGSSLLIISALVAFLPSFTPIPDLPPQRFEEMPSDEMMVRIIRAEEKSVNPESPQQPEGSLDEVVEDADVSMAQGMFGADWGSAEMFWRMHARGNSDALDVVYAVNGYGFEPLSGKADSLFELDGNTQITGAHGDVLVFQSQAKSIGRSK